MDSFTLRVPLGWGRSLDSPRVRAWLADYLRSPGPLPADPGPGNARVSLSLPRRPVRVLAAMHDVPVSVALRRLVAFQSAALPGAAPSVLSRGGPLVLERPLAGSLDPLGLSAEKGAPGLSGGEFRALCKAGDDLAAATAAGRGDCPTPVRSDRVCSYSSSAGGVA